MGASPSTRTTQVFINFRNNTNLDAMGFAPFGEVVSGIEVVDKIYTGYGEGAPRGSGPPQARVQAEGNAYLIKSFPKMDYIKKATIEP
jgi:peptidyl-prolyl cis-trans isomerase A (cyclophilin A)